VIADTFLSMNAPAQVALPAWLGGREDLQAQIRERVRSNLEALRAAGLDMLRTEAGWSAVLPLRGWDAGVSAAEALLEEAGA
jgi:hypothetical protein